MDISIIIVNYESRQKTFRCLESIRKVDFGVLKSEIFVIDNGSEDKIEKDIRRYYPKIKYIRSDTNLGMGGGNNLGIKQAQGEFILILNMDTRLKEKSISVLHDYIINHEEVGIVAPELLNKDGSHQDSCFRFPSFFIPIIRRTFLGKFFQGKLKSFTMKEFGSENIIAVDWVMGSCMLIRKKAFDDVGGQFDERFFMYLEDTDLCRRMWQNNWKVIYNPEAQIIHDHGRGSAKKRWYIAPFTERLAREHIKSWLKYFVKWGIH